ncbi:MAG: immunoglobulin domain-containing protein [Verrucomicrobia bacterium]|nr:immunoglobulin domain-containing protein [Verrucomicrobiota bacterium]
MRRRPLILPLLSLALALAGECLAVSLLPPVITQPPQDRTVNQGISATFRVEANGYPPLRYQWRKDGAPVPSGTNVFLTVLTTNAPAVFYDVVVTNAYGAVTSAPARLIVRTQAPGITVEPVSQVACTGSSISFTSTAGGIGPFTFRWQLDGSPVGSPSTNGLLRLTNVTSADAGDYRVVVTNLYGAVTSAVASLTVDSPLPVITVQPRSLLGYAGNSVAFNVQAVSCSPAGFQWRSNGVALAGATNTSLSFFPLRLDMTADYDVVVANTSGSVTSQLAILVVTNSPPVLTCQPQSKTVSAGSFVFFSVCFSSPYPSGLQWWHDGQPVSASVSNLLVISNVWTNHAGHYWCVVTNRDGRATSDVATLTVTISEPIVLQQPQSLSVDAGTTARLTVSVTAAPPARLQWLFNEQVIPGATGAILDLWAISTSQAGDYRVVVSNILGVVTSDVATVTVLTRAPTIEQQPQSQTVNVGSSVGFSVVATGSLPLTYRWQRNEQSFPATGSPILTLYSVLTNHAGDYRVVVSNAFGMATSEVAHLTVTILPPVVTTPPRSLVADVGATPTFTVGVTGTWPFQYQWQRNGLDIPGATSSELYVAVSSTNQAGGYRVIVWNSAGVATSAVATLTVLLRPPEITQQPQTQTVEAGHTAYFYIYTTGGYPQFFQWQFNGQDLPGATNGYLNRYAPTTNETGDYRVVVTNVFGAATSQVARLTVEVYPPQIYQQPSSQSVDADGTAQLYIGVTGTQPLSFQWRRDGVDLPGKTESWLYFERIATNDAGAYQVVVSNLASVVTSEVAIVTVNLRAPAITTEPPSQTVDAGNTVYFTAYANGAPQPTAQWQRDGQDIPGATNASPFSLGSISSTLQIDAVTSNDAGGYRLIASNIAGVVTSATATLTVLYRPPVFVSLPSSQTVYAGGSAYFSCDVAGGPKPALQWLFNGQPIPNATNAAFYLYIATTNQAGDYSVVASNVFDAITSPAATLTVLVTPPGFSLQPVSQGIIAGESAQFLVSTYGSPPHLQWQFNGQDLPGATNSPLYIENATTNHSGEYRVIAANEGGSATSLVATLVVSPPGPLDRWQWRNPLPQGNDLWCAAYGNGIWVALGRNGTRIRSTDGGVTWQNHHQGEADIRTVAFGNGVFVAAGFDWRGTRYLSWLETTEDGIHWTNHYSGLLENEMIQDVAFGNDRFVAVSGTGAVLSSTNGTNWTKAEEMSLNGMTRLAFGNGSFVALTPYYQATTNGLTGTMAVSSDGLSWTTHNVAAGGYFSDIIFGNGKFVACGYTNDYSVYPYARCVASVSTDGVSWAAVALPTNGTLSAIAYGGGRFVAVADHENLDGTGTGLTVTSTDATNWTVNYVGRSNELYGVAYGGGRFVAVGDKGGIFTSTNGETWTTRSPGSPVNLRGITRGRGLYVAVGNEGLVWTSPNGVAWTRHQAPTTSNLRSVAFGAGQFVAVGDVSENEAVVLTSTNGINWTGANSTLAYGIYSITYGKGLFVAAGWNGAIVTSPDGRLWSARNSGTTRRLNAITFGGGQFVVVGRRGAVVTSSDGAQWVSQSPPTSSFLQGVAYGNGFFVAGGESGTLFTSTNAVNWTGGQPGAQAFGYTDIEDVQFADDTFVAVGASGLIATSADAGIWTRHRTGCQNDLRCSVYAEGYLTAVGNNETILQSDFFGPPILRVRAVREGQGFEFSVDGEVGRAYRLQASDDLRHWEDVFHFTNTRVTTFFFEPEAEFLPWLFYRVVSP